ncbi:urea transporter [Microbacteriaceae bacterium K1510]|nr:urea transporter [Microbacteriaceae bacterium K1510]
MIRLRFISLALGSTFLVKSPWISALFWIAIVRDVRFPIFAFIGLVIADGVAWVLGVDEQIKRGGALRNNAIFASLAVAWLTTASGRPLEVQLALEVSAAVAASLIAAAFIRILRDSILPPLGWGFYIVAGVLFALFSSWTQSALVATVDWPRPNDVLSWIESFFRSLGMMLFLPKVEVGVLVFIAMLLWSRLMLLSGIIGWICGVAIGLLFEKMGLYYLWLLAAHNYFLAAMLLASVLFLPDRSLAFIAVLAGISASVLSAYFQYVLPGSSYAFLPVPAALTVWFGVGALLLSDGAALARRNLASNVPPEVAWWNAAHLSERFGRGEPLLTVPLSGPMQITQGFDGPLSHVGRWRHALDFQRPSGWGATIWEAPVYAPAAGYVEAARSDVVDNPLGVSNFAEMWGNHVIIRLDAGGWALLAHLKQNSVAVSSGMHIENGTYIGLVGNSGRSPTPHLHLHAQIGPAISSPTCRFRLANFLSAAEERPDNFVEWHAAMVPPGGMMVCGTQPNPRVHETVTTMAPGMTVWRVESNGHIPRPFARYGAGAAVRVRIFVDEYGRHLFRTIGDGSLVTSTDPDAWRVIETRELTCPLLKLMAIGAPCVPYAAFPGMIWREPLPLPPRGATAWWDLLTTPYRSKPFTYLVSTCVNVPGEQYKAVTVETKPIGPVPGLPAKVTVHVERLRGPVRIEAEFAAGSLSFSLFSFEPGLPFERRDKQRG